MTSERYISLPFGLGGFGGYIACSSSLHARIFPMTLDALMTLSCRLGGLMMMMMMVMVMVMVMVMPMMMMMMMVMMMVMMVMMMMTIMIMITKASCQAWRSWSLRTK